MDSYKRYLESLRKYELKDLYLQVLDDLSPQIKSFVFKLCNLVYKDGAAIYTYYGDTKQLIESFIEYNNNTVDRLNVNSEEICKTITKNKLLILIDKTIEMQNFKQIHFEKEYLPNTPDEQKNTEAIKEEYDNYIIKLCELRQNVEHFDKAREDLYSEEFIKENMKVTVENSVGIFELTHRFISGLLGNRIYQLRASLEEIVVRVKNNLKSEKTEYEKKLTLMLNRLYDAEKEQRLLYRQDRRSSRDIAEMEKRISEIRNGIEVHSKEAIINQLTAELEYWEERVKDFLKSSNLIRKLKRDELSVIEQIKIYERIQQCPDFPGAHNKCWKIMGENFRKRKEFLEAIIVDACQVLVTHFSVKGMNNKLHTDENGSFYIDEYKHQVYLREYGSEIFHVTCTNELEIVENKDAHYVDEFGRYTLGKDGNKLYQRGRCASVYKLDQNTDLFVKVTEDCGHSEVPNKECGMEMRDPNENEILPTKEPVDIRKTLSPEVVKYLWDAFGPLLPDALNDVGTLRPKNPIHYLAHRLLAHKYNSTQSRLEQKRKEADEYRANIYKQRKEKAIAQFDTWKAKQVKRRKPEESDDAEMRAAYEAQIRAQDFIVQLNNYDG